MVIIYILIEMTFWRFFKRRKYIKPYYCINPSAFKLTQLLSVQNIKELNNLGKYLYVAGKIRNSEMRMISVSS
jgi:hypothetical protein